MQNRVVKAIDAGFKSACGLLVPLGFDLVGIWAAGLSAKAFANSQYSPFVLFFFRRSDKTLSSNLTHPVQTLI
jgi:hypothetical protein